MEKKKKFKFPIRKELFTSILTMVIMFGLMFAFMPLFGMSNALIIGMGLMTILMVTKNDYSLHIKKNSIFFFIVQMSIVALAFAASFSLAAKIPISFAVFFLIIYIFAYDDKMSIYLPFLLNFIMMLTYPVYGTDLGIRFAIVAVETIIMMLLQVVLHRNKFQKKTKKQLLALVPKMESQIKAIENREDTEVILKMNNEIAATLTNLQGSLDAKMGHFAKKWEDGNRYLKGVLLFKRINLFLADTYCTTNTQTEIYSPDVLDSLTSLLTTVVRYEQQEIDRHTVELAIYDFSNKMGHSTLTYEIETDFQLFKKEHIDDQEQVKPISSFWTTFKNRLNMNNFIYALKVSLLCIAGMLVTDLLHLPKGYIFPLSVIIVTQPYTKLTRKAAGSRMLNTAYAVIIYLLAFLFTDLIWVNILILVALILIGDFFLKFNFNVVITGIMTFAMTTFASSSSGLTGTEYAFLRLAYVCAACILIVLIDSLIFPRHVQDTIKKQLKHSVALNQQMVATLSNSKATVGDIISVLKEKRAVNRKLQFNQQYVKLDEIQQYLLSDQEWTERIYFLIDGLNENKITINEISSACQILNSENKTITQTLQETDFAENAMIINVNNILNGMQFSQTLAKNHLEAVGTK